MLDGHVELRFVRVLDGQHFLPCDSELQVFQAEVFADAMLHVDNKIAFEKFCPVRNLCARMKLSSGTQKFVPAENFRVRDDGDLRFGPDQPA